MKVMKVSFSISEAVGKRLKASAERLAGGNQSLLADLALGRFLELSDEELGRLVNRQQMDRMAVTRDGWNRAFWLVLGELLGRVDMIDNPFAPRTYGAFYVVLLLNHMNRYDDENDDFHLYVAPQMSLEGSPSPRQWDFRRTESPIAAAEIVAAHLRDHGVIL